MTLQEKILKKDILKEWVKGVHFPVFCDEEGNVILSMSVLIQVSMIVLAVI